MGKGFIFGMIWGVVVSIIILAVGSVALPLPGERRAEMPIAESLGEDGSDDVAMSEVSSDAAASADADINDTVPQADTTPADVPQTPNVETSMTAPSLPENVDAPSADTSTQVTLSPDVMQPQMPDLEGNATIAQDPAQPPVPVLDEGAPVVGLQGDGPALTAPQVGQESTSTETAMASPDADDETDVATLDGDNTQDIALPPPLALEAFAVPFSNPEARPIVSIVLMDGGASAFPTELLAELPVPVSFAVEAGTPRARERMQRYRDAGFEVLVIPAVAPDADLAQMNSALDAAIVDVPEAVAFLDPFDNGFSHQRGLAETGIGRLLETGHGLLHISADGANPDLIAMRAGVPSITVQRDFDAKGESARVITRFFDQAAFKARQSGAVVMLGRARPETFGAITTWAARSRASSVAIAPVSAAFRAAFDG